MRIKKSIVSQQVNGYSLDAEKTKDILPQDGHLGLFEIIETGKHITVQSDSKRNVAIFPGDRVIAAFANRYATSQFEGYVPTEHLPEYDILGAGGAIGVVKSKNAALSDIEPTKVKLISFLFDEKNEVINTKFLGLERPTFNNEKRKFQTVLSLGSTMDSGKTTSAAFIARGLALAGKKVAFIKLTGTAYTKDKDFVYDCGAELALDFSDAGYPSTFMCSKEEILSIYQHCLNLIDDSFDFLVMEIADGILQRETNFLIRDENFMNTIDYISFSCGDSLSALHGIQMLNEWNIRPTFISGKFTMSDLLIHEVAGESKMPVLTIQQMEAGDCLKYFNK